MLRPFHRRLWLFADRESAADDNARALFEYVCSLPSAENPPACVFAVAGGAKKFGEVPPRGRIDDIRGLRYKLHFLLADFVVSSHRQRIQRMPFSASLLPSIVRRSMSEAALPLPSPLSSAKVFRSFAG